MAEFGIDLNALWGNGWTLLFTGLRVALVYFILLGFLFISGRRTLGQLTSFDLVTLLLLSNVVQNAMIGPDNSLLGGILGAGLLLVLNRWVARNKWLRGRLEPAPVMLVYQGRILSEHLEREDISLADLESAIREHGYSDINTVETAVLEMDGTISVIPKDQTMVQHKIHKVKSSRNH
jgi:uncharacterized membrane protein YcaP (DUF421 family)